jgi:hypothetical protein
MWTAAANAGDLKLLLALKPKPAQIQTICESTLNGSRATEEDRLNILEYFYNQKKYDLKKLPLEKAAANGDLKILQWALKRMSTFFSKAQLSKDVVFAAIKNGHLPILIWAESEGFRFYVAICHLAALAGHLHILQWARENGIPWNNKTICRTAVESKNLELMMWIKAAGAEWRWDVVIEKAIKCGLVTVLQWAKESGAPMNLEAICESAHIDDQEAVIHWAIDADKDQHAQLAIKGT